MNDFVLARPNGRRFVGGPPIPSSPLRLFPLRCCCCFACSCMCTDVSFFLLLLLLRLLDAAGLIKKKRARRIRMEHDAKFISGKRPQQQQQQQQQQQSWWWWGVSFDCCCESVTLFIVISVSRRVAATPATSTVDEIITQRVAKNILYSFWQLSNLFIGQRPSDFFVLFFFCVRRRCVDLVPPSASEEL